MIILTKSNDRILYFTTNPQVFTNNFKDFFMKKLIIVMSCVTAAVLMSSCTTDSIDDIKKENAINSQEVSTIDASPETPTNPPAETDTTTGVDDRDKSKG